MAAPESRPTVLFIHGGGMAGWMWRPQVEALREFRCLTPDLPGHGDALSTPFSLDAAIDALTQLLERETLDEPVHVVGLSLGGTVALLLAEQRPSAVASVMVSAASIGPLPGGPLATWLTNLTVPLTRLPFVVRQSARQFGIPPALMPYYERDVATLSADTYRRFNDVFDEFQAEDVPRLAGVRVLVMAGEREPGFIRENQRKILTALASGRGFLAPGGNHTWNFGQPALFNQTVRQWVLNQPLPAELIPM